MRSADAPEAPAAAASLMPARLGPYAIVRPLGHGGMASVYEGVHIGLGKRVAIKVLQPHLAANETTAARFVREGRAVARIHHPHVVEVFDVGLHEGVPYLVMELLEGVDLSEYLKCNAPLSLDETTELLLPIISAVAAAHEAGIVHRDLKPANVFLARGRHAKVDPKVVDFGISTFMDKDGNLELTQTHAMLGTIRYMSPEQTRGAKYADARSDQYALGLMVYLCVTGKPPFVAEGVYEMIHAIRNAPLVPPSQHNPKLPPDFDDVVMRAMSREPANRFPSVAELGRALLPFAGRRSSASWEREFVPDDGAGPKLGRGQRATLPEGTEAKPDPKPATTREDPTLMTSESGDTLPRSGGRTRMLLAVVGGAVGLGVAVAVILAVVSRGPEPRVQPPTPAAPVLVASEPTTAEPTPTANTTGTATATPTLASTPTPTAAPTLASTATGISSAASSAKPRPRVIARPAQGAPKPKLGSNGSPILE